MTIQQQIALFYFKHKFKIISIFSVQAAAKSAFNLFCTPFNTRKSYNKPKIFEEANDIIFHFRQHSIHGFEWLPEKSNGKKILICHGFDSLSYKFASYVAPLLNGGYTVYAFDAPAHGLSTGKKINALLYRDLIIEINNRFGYLDTIIAHSFGCIAATLAIENSLMLLKQLIILAPATETKQSLADFSTHLQLSFPIRNELENIIVKIGGQPSSWYSVARIIKSVQIPTLWIHDQYDPITPFKDVDPIVQLKLKHVDFIITRHLGHSLYKKEEVKEQVIQWLRQRSAIE